MSSSKIASQFKKKMSGKTVIVTDFFYSFFGLVFTLWLKKEEHQFTDALFG